MKIKKKTVIISTIFASTLCLSVGLASLTYNNFTDYKNVKHLYTNHFSLNSKNLLISFNESDKNICSSLEVFVKKWNNIISENSFEKEKIKTFIIYSRNAINSKIYDIQSKGEWNSLSEIQKESYLKAQDFISTFSDINFVLANSSVFIIGLSTIVISGIILFSYWIWLSFKYIKFNKQISIKKTEIKKNTKVKKKK